MTCKSAIYAVNETNATVTTANEVFVQVPFGSVVRRYGQALGLDGGSILCCQQGYFDVEGSLTFTPTAAGPITVQIRQDGVPVPGMTKTVQGTAAEPAYLGFTGLVRNCGECCNSALTCWINAAGTITSLSTVVEKQ